MKARNLLGVLAGAAVAAEKRIGVNFVGAAPESQTLAADAVAGAEEVAQAHWNNLEITQDDANGHGNSGGLEKVVDGTGGVVRGLSVMVAATESTQVWPVTGAGWGFEGANLTMQLGHLHPQARITVKGIPYAKYDVYAYAAAGDNGGQGSVTIAVAGTATGKVALPPIRFYNFKWLGGKFVPATATTLEEAQKSEGSNCVVFKGNSAKAFTLDWDGKLGGGWTGVSAIQIVPAP
jgi:hypothetical protein